MCVCVIKEQKKKKMLGSDMMACRGVHVSCSVNV